MPTDDLFKQFAFLIEDELKLDTQIDQYWNVPLTPANKCTRFLEKRILKACGTGGFLLALDEADHLLGSPVCSDFFGMLRSWHNSDSLTGKSSLKVRTALKLEEQGVLTAIIDLASIGTRDTSAEQWYLGVLAQIESFCSPETDLFSWWHDNAALSTAQRFTNYMGSVLLKEIPQKIVIFVDEIDSTLGLGFTDDFFSAIRAFHNGRATHLDLYSAFPSCCSGSQYFRTN